jgi:hypothetical protein
MKLAQTALFSLPLIVFATSASADSEDKKKRGAVEAPTEAPKAEETPAPAPPAAQPVQPTPTPAPPAVGTTQTTAAYVAETQEQPVEKPKGNRVGNRVSVEPLVGAGTNHFNFGAGGRIGYTFKVPVYIGATFMWHHGDKDQFSTANTFTEAKTTYYYPGGELGYDIGLAHGQVMLRPYAGGAELFRYDRVSTNGIAVSDTSNQFMIYPGLAVHYNVPRSPVFIGGDTRLLIPTLHNHPSYQGFFVAGLSM